MPDIWTKHPELVRQVLARAGFEFGVKPTILPEREPIVVRDTQGVVVEVRELERKPEWTCRKAWPDYYVELYIHQTKE